MGNSAYLTLLTMLTKLHCLVTHTYPPFLASSAAQKR